MRLRTTSQRSGAAAVEAAVSLPALLILMIGLAVGGLGIFRYNEVSMLAREGSRWASVHGATYQSDSGASAAITADDVYNKAIKPMATALDSSKLTYTLAFSPDSSAGSTVTVTVKYQWYPEAYLGGPISFTSSSTRTISY
jgi:Flp pilus assembly protein TadG